jgi:hypothetical protein
MNAKSRNLPIVGRGDIVDNGDMTSSVVIKRPGDNQLYKSRMIKSKLENQSNLAKRLTKTRIS